MEVDEDSFWRPEYAVVRRVLRRFAPEVTDDEIDVQLISLTVHRYRDGLRIAGEFRGPWAQEAEMEVNRRLDQYHGDLIAEFHESVGRASAQMRRWGVEPEELWIRRIPDHRVLGDQYLGMDVVYHGGPYEFVASRSCGRLVPLTPTPPTER